MEINKKARFKKKAYLLLIFLVAVLVAVVLGFSLLLHRPSSYKPLNYSHNGDVSLYLTHQLLPEFYNGVQLQEPFELVITQSGINDTVARFKWPQEFGGIRLSAPMVVFAPDSIVLMGTVFMEGAEFVGTAVVEPKLDTEGLLNLSVVSVKIGAVDITPLARVLAGRICRRQFAAANISAEDLRAQIAAALLDGEPFKPVFKIEDKKVRVEQIKIEQEKLTIRLVPVFD